MIDSIIERCLARYCVAQRRRHLREDGVRYMRIKMQTRAEVGCSSRRLRLEVSSDRYRVYIGIRRRGCIGEFGMQFLFALSPTVSRRNGAARPGCSPPRAPPLAPCSAIRRGDLISCVSLFRGRDARGRAVFLVCEQTRSTLTLAACPREWMRLAIDIRSSWTILRKTPLISLQSDGGFVSVHVRLINFM